MVDSSETLRTLLSQRSHRNWTTGYPDALRRRVAAYAWERHRQGAQWREVAESLDLSKSTLHRWVHRWNGTNASPTVSTKDDVDKGEVLPVFLPVEVTPEPEWGRSEGLFLVTPAGYRACGLDLASLTLLLERLG